MVPIRLFRAEGVLKASALLLNPTGASQFLRSDNSKVWGSPCLARVTPCLAGQPLKLLSSAPRGAPALSGVHTVDGPELLAGTGTSKMGVEGGGSAWGGLNTTWRLWKGLCKPQVFTLEDSRHWSVWVVLVAWFQRPGWSYPHFHSVFRS